MLELAIPQDRKTILQLKHQVHSLHVAWRPDIYQMDDDLYPEEIFKNDIRDKCLYVAKIGGIVVGYTCLQIRQVGGAGQVPTKDLHLKEICVDESVRGTGIGTEMMADVRALARAFGCSRIRIGVYPQNEPAIAFYQKCGFRIRSISMDCNL